MGQLLADLIGKPQGWQIVSSPVGRARATAEIIARKMQGLPIELDDRLKEMSWGAHDGRLRSELEAEYPETFGKPGWAFEASSSESYEVVACRIGDWLASLPLEPQRRIIAVSHGISGRVLRGIYANQGGDASAQQDAPQDAVYRLAHGEVTRIDGEPAN